MADQVPSTQIDELLGARPRSRARRWVSIGLLLLALAAAATLLLRFLEGNDTPYYMAPITRGDLRPQLSLPGSLYPAGEITVRAPHDALLTALPQAVGQRVADGQALAVIDTTSYVQLLDADRASLAAARDEASREAIASRAAAARLARFEAVWRASRQRVPSLDELEAARMQAARAALAARRARTLADAAAQRLQADTLRLQAALPRAPVAGVVSAQLVAAGSWVRAGQPILRLAPLGAAARVAVTLDAIDAPLPPGMPVKVVIGAAPPRAATLLHVQAGPAGRLHAVFALPPDPRLPPRASVTVRLNLPLRRHVLLVPDAALAFAPHCSAQRGRDSICLLARDGTARSVPIVAGPSDGQHTQILAGKVRPGQLAIIGWREAPAASSPSARQPGH